MKTMNPRKYKPYPAVEIPDRTWPSQTITRAPIWCSVDLRDGNQALSSPMGVEAKLEFFRMLVKTGFKEIEIGFPAASSAEFEFVRRLIEGGHIPDDVTIQVLTQAREEIIRRTFDSVRGAKNVIIHVYNSTSPAQRALVFGKSREEILELAVSAGRTVREIAGSCPETNTRLEYSPESFTATEPDFAVEICDAVMNAWAFKDGEKIILNLPATVEMSTPNVYADRVEWFLRRLKRRDRAVLSVHTHNDRGTAVAAAELAVMAGAQRVEGALFGNGERSGNMDLVTMALNLFSQGVDSGLDFSDMDGTAEIYRRLTGMPVHPRHPYAGELVYTAFSGSHQDAIAKGMKARSDDGEWNVPYLPIDPKDVGRNYEAVIRVNSQSGKGGMSFLLEKDFGILIPRWMQKDFSRAVQKAADEKEAELSARDVYAVFKTEYLDGHGSYQLTNCHIDSHAAGNHPAVVNAVLSCAGKELRFDSTGNGPVDAFVRGLARVSGKPFTLEDYAEHALSHGADASAVAYVRVTNDKGKAGFGAGTGTDISAASIRAVLSAWNKLYKLQ